MNILASHFSLPRSRADWRALALGLAELPADQFQAREHSAFDQLRDTAWDVATYAAFWRTVQLPSLGPGLLPLVVLVLLMISQAAAGHGSSQWPSPSDPFILWPSLWLLGWFAFTLALAAIRHRRARRRALQLGARLGFFLKSA